MPKDENVVRAGQLYPVAREERLPAGMSRTLTRARWTGETRPPRAGEWYLSGAIVEAWRSPHGSRTPFHIAELVEGEIRFN